MQVQYEVFLTGNLIQRPKTDGGCENRKHQQKGKRKSRITNEKQTKKKVQIKIRIQEKIHCVKFRQVHPQFYCIVSSFFGGLCVGCSDCVQVYD